MPTPRKQKDLAGESDVRVLLEEAPPVTVAPRKRRVQNVKLKAPDATASSFVIDPQKSSRRMLVWVVTGVVMVVVIGVWIMLFRWNTRGSARENVVLPLNDTKDALKKSVDELQKNFSSITQLIEDRFASSQPDAKGTEQLSPEALHELQNRLNDAAGASSNDAVIIPKSPIDFNLRTWQPYTSDVPAVQLRYPKGWVFDPRVVVGERIAAFAPNGGGVFGSSEIFIDVRLNPKQKTLNEFYKEQDRINFYQAARGGTETVYVDGIRAVQFNDVVEVTPETIVSVRRGTSVFEFSVLGTDEEHKKLLQTLVSTVRFQ